MNDKLNFNKILGKNIFRKRKLINKNQEQLGEALELSRATIVNIEKGRHQLNAYQLWLVVRFLKTTYDDLMPTEKQFLENTDLALPDGFKILYSKETIEDFQKLLDSLKKK